MKQVFLLSAVIFLVALLPLNAIATSFGTNITISDKNSALRTGWYGEQEDNEVEPGMEAGQKWDLEGFFLEGTMLTMVGGFDFINGNSSYNSGDIFIDIFDTVQDAVYGDIHSATNGNKSVLNSFGYDYVLDLTFNDQDPTKAFTYNVYAINGNTKVITAYYGQNQGSSPWRYESGGTLIRHASLTYTKGGEANLLGFSGNGDHNAVSVSLDFLQLDPLTHGTNFLSHFTMGCGNDNLMGTGALPNPEPATLFLMGCGLIGVAGLGRKKFSK
jgi:hypothetical protein